MVRSCNVRAKEAEVGDGQFKALSHQTNKPNAEASGSWMERLGGTKERQLMKPGPQWTVRTLCYSNSEMGLPCKTVSQVKATEITFFVGLLPVVIVNVT